jgi:hypothetical protein
METIHLVSAVGSFIAALFLAGQVLRHGPVSEANGFLYADHLSALVALSQHLFTSSAHLTRLDTCGATSP